MEIQTLYNIYKQYHMNMFSFDEVYNKLFASTNYQNRIPFKGVLAKLVSNNCISTTWLKHRCFYNITNDGLIRISQFIRKPKKQNRLTHKRDLAEIVYRSSQWISTWGSS